MLVHQLSSYRHWQDSLERNDFTYGQFGENLTVDRLADDEVCIGDRHQIGGAVVEVNQSRLTCYRVGLRLGEPQMAALLLSHRHPGPLHAGADGRAGAGRGQDREVSSGLRR
ncbi:MOSC domain-containing protein [Streptomyces sp. NPDC007162]|uniref:MOSC domain-containing protein n=1 Tax=Streptomyces sp. NPDC007162 TaxID=3156917 RepID=UPI0033C09856